MNYQININQYAGEKYFPELDIIDLAVYDYISKFYPVAEKYTDNNGIWFWISHSKVIDDMPKLKIKSKSGILKRINNLVDNEILERHPNSKTLGRSYYKVGKKWMLLTKVDTYGRKYAGTTDESPQVPTDESTQDHYTNLDHITKDPSIRSDEKEFSSPEPEILEEYSGEKKEKETLFDISTKPQEKKQRKNSGKKKEPTLTHKMRQAFESYYEAEKEEKYYYMAKDGTALKGIISKLTSTIRNKHGSDYNPLDGEMVKSWEYILTNLKSSNIWVYNNLDISKINSQYNQIIANIKSGNNGQTRNGKGATNEEVAEILKKYDIM